MGSNRSFAGTALPASVHGAEGTRRERMARGFHSSDSGHGRGGGRWSASVGHGCGHWSSWGPLLRQEKRGIRARRKTSGGAGRLGKLGLVAELGTASPFDRQRGEAMAARGVAQGQAAGQDDMRAQLEHIMLQRLGVNVNSGELVAEAMASLTTPSAEQVWWEIFSTLQLNWPVPLPPEGSSTHARWVQLREQCLDSKRKGFHSLFALVYFLADLEGEERKSFRGASESVQHLLVAIRRQAQA
ncbi:hypothetical protein C2845_PM05G36940 [Panicum miliaceum]|uniref:Uncharacterized protein n=1 Tax=Panicum miliaceum TaxID=4540 RepID=A0A3L6SWB9_PANMI|nr:hypothetical protein C2845_PM05G36940 [Panicum miliaceum]